MKKLIINKKGQVILHDARDPLIETKGTIVQTSFALISPGTELSIIKWNKLMNLPIYKQIIKSKYIRKRILAELKKNTIKNLFKLFKIYKEKSSYKNYSKKSDNLTQIGYSCSGIVNESNIDDYQLNNRVACAGSYHAERIFSL